MPSQEEGNIKTLYLIRHGQSDWSDEGASDFERGLTKKGRKNVKMMASYLKLRGVYPDIVLASCAVRAQQTADLIAEVLEYKGHTEYLQELYYTPTETLKEMLTVQDDEYDTIFVVGHNPQVTDMANMLIDEHISKLPAAGIIAIDFDMESWADIADTVGKIDFFIHPKQFKYYVPNQIRAVLAKTETGRLPDVE